MRGFRGFFLADPEELSLLALVEQFAESGPPGRGRIFRIRRERLPGNRDCEALRGSLLRETIVRRVVQRADWVRVTIDDRSGRRSELSGRYFVCAPASTARG